MEPDSAVIPNKKTNMLNLLDIHKQMLPNSISMIFKGAVTFELIDSIISIISSKLDEIEDNLNTRKKVFAVLMECLQNLGCHVEQYYSNENTPRIDAYDASSVLIMIDSVEEGYSIMTANFISNDKVESLKQWIEELNLLDKTELRLKYNEILQNGSFTHKGGGGLGFVDIALKVEEKLGYEFHKVNDELSFFSFKTIIKKHK